MPIEMPRGLPFSVDTWSPSSKRKRHHFLTHAHKDHSNGISSHSSYPIYATHLTKSLVLQHFPQVEESLFLGIEVGQSLVIDDLDAQFSVTAFDANHCPGAVMFLFEGNFGNILHTGDCRLTPECLQHLPEKYLSKKGKQPRCQLDYVFLDCTFGKFPEKFPSKHSAIKQVISCIWKHPAAAVVYLTCDLLGQEDILTCVSQTFGSKIFVDRVANPESFAALEILVPEILSEDPLCRFHLFDGFPKLYERAAAKLAEAQAGNQPELLIIRPSAQWYACDEDNLGGGSKRKMRLNEAVRDPFGVWHVCYSMHSSREELEWALQLLGPKWVVSTTPSCRAMELDYVKKHCFGTRVTSDDPFWKLMDISVEGSSEAEKPVKDTEYSHVIKGPAQIPMESQCQSVKVISSQFLTLSSPEKEPPVTLFGRVRLGIRDFDFPPQKKMAFKKDESPKVVKQQLSQDGVVLLEENAEVKCDNKIACKIDEAPKAVVCQRNQHQTEVFTSEAETTTEHQNKLDNSNVASEQDKKLPKREVSNVSSCSPIGSSKRFSENLRRLYRAMNVPVPRPLPRLVELQNSIKRTKRRFEF